MGIDGVGYDDVDRVEVDRPVEVEVRSDQAWWLVTGLVTS